MFQSYQDNERVVIQTLSFDIDDPLPIFNNEMLAEFEIDEILTVLGGDTQLPDPTSLISQEQEINVACQIPVCSNRFKKSQAQMVPCSRKTWQPMTANDKNKRIEEAHKNFQEFLLYKMDGLNQKSEISTAMLYDQLPTMQSDQWLYTRLVAMEYMVLAKDGVWTPFAGMFTDRHVLQHTFFRRSIRKVEAAIPALTAAFKVSSNAIALTASYPDKNLLVFSYSALLTLRDIDCVKHCVAGHVWKRLLGVGLSRHDHGRSQCLINATIQCWYKDWQIHAVNLDIDLNTMYESYKKI